jgi:aromatic ring-opening dioxygenase catalytic subunit (LigB family)
MLYDYYGFPPEAYTITWPAAGDPALAARVQALLNDAGISSAADATRGFDHGTFVPLKLTYPGADIPALQLSLMSSLDPAQHIAMGRALVPLRDEGVFIVASGMTFHNLRALRGAGTNAALGDAFDAWLGDTMQQEPAERDRRLTMWGQAPGARFAHPREEHLLPLMVAAGAAESDRATASYSGTFMGLRHSAFNFGVGNGANGTSR